jgi:uncharacterized repeat protein (TIGR02543 family)
MKKLPLFAVILIGLAACANPSGGDGNDGGENNIPANDGTAVVFNNTQGICAAAVYTDPLRRESDKIAEVPGGGSSALIPWSAGGFTFYFSYLIEISGVEGITIKEAFVPEVGRDQKVVRIDAGKSVDVIIPSLKEIISSPDALLSQNTYLILENRSSFSFRLSNSGTIITPENIPASLVNTGEQALYRINAGTASVYTVLAGAGSVSFPAPPAMFEKGHVYGFTFTGGALTLNFDKESTMGALFHWPAYTVTYNANGGGGSAPSPQTAYEGTIILLPDQGSLTFPGKIFAGWNTAVDGTGTSYAAGLSYMVSVNTTLYAQWSITPPVTYTVTYDANGAAGAVPAAQTVNAGTTILLPDQGSLVFSGKVFAGWNTAAEGTGTSYAADSNLTVTENIMLYARWSIIPPVTYTVTFNTGEGSPSTQTVINGASLGSTMPSNPTRSGHSFGGWYTAANGEGSEFTAATPVIANITVYAWWLDTSIQYTVTFDTGEGSPATRTVTNGDSVGSNMPTDPTRSGYVFNGWYTAGNGEGSEFTAATMVTGYITVYAWWKILYTLTFDADGGIPATDSRIVTDGDSIGFSNMPPSPARSGHIFHGWYTEANGGGNVFTAATPVTANSTVYARWTLDTSISYTVIFDANGGSPATQTRTVTNGGSLGSSGMPLEPIRTGFVFIGWYTAVDGAGTEFTAATIITGNIPVYASWKIRLTFDAAGGDPATQTRMVTEGASLGSSGMPLEPIRTGWFFMGWYTAANGGGNEFTAATTATENITLYAQWIEKAGLYKISAIPANKIGNQNLAESLEYITAHVTSGDEYFIVLGSDESASNIVLTFSGLTVDIILTGDDTERSINLDAATRLFAVLDSVTLVLDNNVTLLGRDSNNSNSLVTVSSGGTLKMYNGAKISGNTFNTSSGGGVRVYNGGAFAMSGGEIIGNHVVSGMGGGVYIDTGGTFTMSGGEIRGNSANSYNANNAGNGGGVIVGGTFIMSGGKISGNTAHASYVTTSAGNGGGVYVSGGTFAMSGGEISGNTASATSKGGSGLSGNRGGGVYVNGGTFTKSSSGGIIYGSDASEELKNTATIGFGSGYGLGHAVYVESGAKKRDATVSAGTALNSNTAGGWE